MPHFYLRVVPADKTRVIISVSKKIAKKAVVRNRIRRRVRALLPKFISGLRPADYFIVAKPEADGVKGKELELELATLFKRS